MESIKVELGQKNSVRLEQKQYSNEYTNIPNSALPASHLKQLDVVFEALTGESMPSDCHTYVVKAEEGRLKRLYSPALVRINEGGNSSLVIRWGDISIPLEVSGGKLTPPNSSSKVRFSFGDEKISDTLTLTHLTLTVTKNKTLYLMECPVIPADTENPTRSEVLDVLLDDDPGSLVEHIGALGVGSRFQGSIIKAGYLPLGEYEVTGFKRYENKQYGPQYTVQVVVPEAFKAPVNVKDEEGNWEAVETEIEGFAQVKANSYLKRALSAEPIISEERPAKLTVLEHGEFNGHRTAKMELVCSSFTEDSESLKLSF